MEVGQVKRIYVEVMTSGEALNRFGRALRRSGKIKAAAEPTIAVGSIGELTALLSPKRMDLLKHVVQHRGLSVRALSKALGRDYKNVHTDVTELEASRLLERDAEGRVTAPFDEIVIRAPLHEAA